MNKEETLIRIRSVGLLAVIRGPSPEMTLKMVGALIQGGVTGIEITYSTPDAESVVRMLVETYRDEILLGMGTLTEPEQAERSKKAGAQFLVSPICEPDLVKAMAATGLVTLAGALTPTEVLQAYRLGSDIVKIFPGSLAGPAYVKALRGPFPDIPIMPTGGVNAGNIGDWFSAGVAAVGVGSELCPTQLAIEGRFDEITRRATEFIQIVNKARQTIAS